MQLHLFDMDAVLVHPGGYHAALVATVNHVSRALGFGDFGPGPDEIAMFEAAGITSEWDSAPIAIAEIARIGGRPDYAALIRRVSREWKKGEYAAEAAFRLLGPDAHLRPDTQVAQTGEVGGPGRLSLADILLHSRDIHRSPVLAIFQQFTLGPAFEPTYGLPRTLATDALLLKLDRPALTRAVPLRSAIYTARPCRPPRDVPPRPGYAPEAELGAQLVGLGDLPLIGFGSFQWLAETLANGTEAEHYLKPSPAHGLAALAAASGAPESACIRAAEAAMRDEWVSPLRELRGTRGRVIVFEDSARSIEGVREAARMLGGHWSCTGVGIAAGGPKHEALLKSADRIYASIDEAIDVEVRPDSGAQTR